MSETLDRYKRVANGFGERLSGVKPEQWSGRTPCSDWDVRELVDHVVTTHMRVVASLGGDDQSEIDSSRNVASRWIVASGAVIASLDDAERASKTVRGMFGEQSFELLVSRLLCADTLFHTWDLARATGQDERLDPDAVDKAFEFLEPLDDAIRKPGGFSEKIDAPVGADAQTRLLYFGGRVA